MRARDAIAPLGYSWPEPIRHVAGVDEAGCDSLAGPMVAAAGSSASRGGCPEMADSKKRAHHGIANVGQRTNGFQRTQQ